MQTKENDARTIDCGSDILIKSVRMFLWALINLTILIDFFAMGIVLFHKIWIEY